MFAEHVWNRETIQWAAILHENALMQEVRAQWSDCLKLTGMQQ